MDLPAAEAWHLPYVDQLGIRELDAISLVVIHCTELPDLATAREYGEKVLYVDTGTGNSGHFYIDRNGRVYEFVPITRVAHHTRGYNPQSIGIELINKGRYPNWMDSRSQLMTEAYTEAQINALSALLSRLQQTLPNLKQIAGHEDLDQAEVPASDDPTVKVWRKRDPGPLFPWAKVLADVNLQRIERASVIWPPVTPSVTPSLPVTDPAVPKSD
ncbi:N-acetylmuramoyl-L-alanine amidase [Ahniella affigens]|uniref:N-acetylmuramoyl-L-alanine amidase n=1 Tax=Ahniella affigens TaxID=2021234 RepID=A0A2P1PNZ3_9GAMM|nr:N-acetylmuramoyl-L-alanine amidase [Ahniella affigens]AVP96563.1 N-acetylmuramoyl-L-alanine amidase [Ahniella affigens]